LHVLTLLRQVAATVGAILQGVFNVVTRGAQPQPELTPGDAAPDFTLAGSDGRTYRLSELKGHPVVIAWFPKAFTGG
jgi:thioredoxin-dependent peroxiredoxin